MMPSVKICETALRILGISEEEISRALGGRRGEAARPAPAGAPTVRSAFRVSSPSSVVYLLLDTSGSMAEGDKLSQAKSGARTFAAKAIGMGYAVGVIRFSDETEVAVEPSTNSKRIDESLGVTEADGGTDLAAALRLTTVKLSGRSCDRAIVLVTDGFPDDRDAARHVANDAKRRGITIIAIGTDDADWAFLAEIASATELARKVERTELHAAISDAARLLPAKGGS